MVKPNAWRLLGKQVKTPNGVRDIVPILGAGFNSHCGLKDSWDNLLNVVDLEKYTFWGCNILACECPFSVDGWKKIYDVLNGSETTTLRT